MKKVLVLGSRGFIGRAVTSYLQNKEVFVVTADRSDTTCDFTVDLKNKDDVLDLVRKTLPSYIINCAGILTAEHCFLNPVFSMNVLSALEVFKSQITCKLIVLGSASEYGIVGKLPVSEDAPLMPQNAYDMSKVIETLSALKYAELHGLNVVIARLFNPIGALMHERTLIPSLIRQVKELARSSQKKLEVNRLDSKRDFLAVSDVAEAIATIALSEENKEKVYNIGSGEEASVEQLIQSFLETVNFSRNIEIVETSEQPEPQYASRADISRISTEFGWKPKNNLREVVNELVNEQE
ncbi:NAD(P)-dependent oxidoreductase [Patescibacteria group bacterium]|nr:NAD(P)-dependent oxidoreductase [Patescibacteria group bacterium]